MPYRHASEPSKRGTDIDTDKIKVDSNRIISGYASVFYRAGSPGTERTLFKGCVQRIARTAFERALSEGQPVQLVLEHDLKRPIASTADGTLRLSVNETGLRYEADITEQCRNEDVVDLIRRKFYFGSSFSAYSGNVTWHTEGSVFVRTIHEFSKMIEVTVSRNPAYAATSVFVGPAKLLSPDDAMRLFYEMNRDDESN